VSLKIAETFDRLIFSAVVAGLLVAGASGCATGQPDVPTPSTQTNQRAVPSATPPAVLVPSSEPFAVDGQAFHPEVGQCLDVRKDRPSGPESIVPCDEVHDDEAYARFTLDGSRSSPYPGEEVIERLANDGCRERFTDFIGIRYEDSVFEYISMYPAEGGWTAHGDRRVTCLVWDPKDSLTGSLGGVGY
jgi:Septum formation